MPRIVRLPMNLALLLSALVGGTALKAQTSGLPFRNTTAGASPSSYVCVARPDDLTMSVNLWGYVHNPGRYEISTSADLIQLLSCAGGPLPEATLGNVTISRLGQSELGETRRQIAVDLDDTDEISRAAIALHPGDIIYVDRSGWVSFRDILGVVTTVALVTTAVASVIISSNR